MIRSTFFLFLFLMGFLSQAQNANGREVLRGQVLYRDSNVPNENVVNSTTGRATITDDNGRFAILAKVGDQLVFTAINYQLEIVVVTEDIMQRKRLVVEVNEKVTELDEVVVSPENQEKFLEMQNDEFKGYEYEIDRATEVENVAMNRVGIQDGLNIKNIFKALFTAVKKDDVVEREPLKVSEVLRRIYDDEFFVVDLRLPQDKIDEFLLYCDDRVPSQELLRRENEFELIDFLVTQSKNFLAEQE